MPKIASTPTSVYTIISRMHEAVKMGSAEGGPLTHTNPGVGLTSGDKKVVVNIEKGKREMSGRIENLEKQSGRKAKCECSE